MTRKFTTPFFAIGLFTLCMLNLAAATGPGIGVTLLSYTLDSANNNSVDLGYTINIYAEVTNYDTSAFSGPLSFGLRNRQDTITNASIFGQPPYSGDIISLGGNQTVPAIFSVIISMPYFIPGPDVVVVWPICNRPVADSILIHLNVLDPSGLANVQGQSFSYSVLSDRILLQSLNAQTDFKQVRIYNLIGQLLSSTQSDFIPVVPLPQMPAGIYFCELFSADGKKNVIRFFH